MNEKMVVLGGVLAAAGAGAFAFAPVIPNLGPDWNLEYAENHFSFYSLYTGGHGEFNDDEREQNIDQAFEHAPELYIFLALMFAGIALFGIGLVAG